MRDCDEGFVPIGDILKQLIGDAATRRSVRFVLDFQEQRFKHLPSHDIPLPRYDAAQSAIEGLEPFILFQQKIASPRHGDSIHIWLIWSSRRINARLDKFQARMNRLFGVSL
jgi:hypothetical protein